MDGRDSVLLLLAFHSEYHEVSAGKTGQPVPLGFTGSSPRRHAFVAELTARLIAESRSVTPNSFCAQTRQQQASGVE